MRYFLICDFDQREQQNEKNTLPSETDPSEKTTVYDLFREYQSGLLSRSVVRDGVYDGDDGDPFETDIFDDPDVDIADVVCELNEVRNRATTRPDAQKSQDEPQPANDGSTSTTGAAPQETA